MLGLKLLLGFLGESLMMSYVSTRLTGVKLDIIRTSLIGLIYGILIYTVRTGYTLMGIPLGTHTIVLLAMFVILVKYIGSLDWINSMVGMLISYSLILVGENVFLLPICMTLKIPLENIFNTWNHVLACYIVDIPLIIMCFFIRFFDFKLIDYKKIMGIVD